LIKTSPLKQPHAEPSYNNGASTGGALAGVFAAISALPWIKLTALLVALLVALPLLNIFLSWLFFDAEFWRHLSQTVLGDLLRNTLVLCSGVALGVFVLGVSLAWLTSMCSFPGRRFFEWALMLPFAVPAYVMAFVFLGIMEHAGPVQSFLRDSFGEGVGFNARSDGAVILVMSLVLYPYVYMLARAAFMSQGRVLLESSRSLGQSATQSFFRVALPMARPGIIAGVSLAVMETLADFGVVSIFNYDTFTTAIYKAWYGFFNLQAASQLASLLLLFVFLGLLMEKYSRGGKKYHQQELGEKHQAIKLTRARSILAFGWCASVLLLAFVVPMLQLSFWAVDAVSSSIIDARYYDFLLHSFLLAGFSAVSIVLTALVLAYASKLYVSNSVRMAVQLSTLGYAIPGSVLAVGIMVSLSQLNHFLSALYQQMNWVAPVLVGTVFTLVFAYAVRFMLIAFSPIETAMQRITPHVSEASRSLGASPRAVLFRVYVPIILPGILTAALMIFVEVLKEMPITLLLRPFGWDTLGVKVYEYTSEGEWALAAVPGLTLVLVGLLPVFLIIRQTRNKT